MTRRPNETAVQTAHFAIPGYAGTALVAGIATACAHTERARVRDTLRQQDFGLFGARDTVQNSDSDVFSLIDGAEWQIQASKNK